jgi:hypothetical protein
MTKVVVTKRASGAGSKAGSVSEKRVRDAEGKLQTVRTLDGRSTTFGSDLTYVFSKNVAKARRENKQATGVTDRAPAKV